eukprot:364482-Chlamydomonas_euryale.AAC.2
MLTQPALEAEPGLLQGFDLNPENKPRTCSPVVHLGPPNIDRPAHKLACPQLACSQLVCGQLATGCQLWSLTREADGKPAAQNDMLNFRGSSCGCSTAVDRSDSPIATA